jgi:hypothetical protein
MLSAAVETTLAELGDLTAFAAEVAAVRMLAEAVEARPFDKDLWREFRLALKAFREATRDDDGIGDGIADLLARLGRPRVGGTPVRDETDLGEGVVRLAR